jgi:hypothetical protein
MNKQPFYHEVSILFTATRELTRAEIAEAVIPVLAKLPDVLADSVDVEYATADPGDPADLL